MKSLDIVATNVVARPSPADLQARAAVAAAPPDEPALACWPGWLRVAILLGGSAGLWGGLAWIAFQVLKLS